MIVNTAEIVGDSLLDLQTLAAFCGLSPGAVRTAIFRNTFPIPPLRIGRRLRWRASDVRRFLESGGTTGATVRHD
jgi:predicted DNA-binding transcriptional regulator AlpA